MSILVKILVIAIIIVGFIFVCQFFQQTRFIYEGSLIAFGKVKEIATAAYTAAQKQLAALGFLSAASVTGAAAIAYRYANTIKTKAATSIASVTQAKDAVESQVTQLKTNITTQETKLNTQTAELNSLRVQLAEAEKFNEDGVGIVTQLKSQLSNKDTEIQALQQLLKEYKVTEKIVVK